MEMIVSQNQAAICECTRDTVYNDEMISPLTMGDVVPNSGEAGDLLIATFPRGQILTP